MANRPFDVIVVGSGPGGGTQLTRWRRRGSESRWWKPGLSCVPGWITMHTDRRIKTWRPVSKPACTGHFGVCGKGRNAIIGTANWGDSSSEVTPHRTLKRTPVLWRDLVEV